MHRSSSAWTGRIAAAAGVFGACLLGQPAQAAVFASWTFPANNAVYPVGSTLVLTGNANTSTTVTGGLDLALVLDSSGSMGIVESGQSRSQWMKDASNALVDALPKNSTSVAVVEFDSSASLVTGLTSLATGLATVKAGINSVDASGGTNIPAGIGTGTLELTGPRHLVDRTQMMVVVSDGETSGNVTTATAAAIAAGVDAVHSVGIPGHSVVTMQAIATAGNGVYTDASDLTRLINLFNGLGGNLVGIDRVDITMNDGAFLQNVFIDGLGNFSTPMATIFAGVNTFMVTAFDDQNNSASATLVINGGAAAVPEPAGLGLLALALAGIGLMHRRRG